MDIRKLVGTILLGVGRVIATPPIARTTERIVSAAMDPRVEPISLDEGARRRTIGNGSVLFPQKARLRCQQQECVAIGEPVGVKYTFSRSRFLRARSRDYYLERYGRDANGKRLATVCSEHAVLLRWHLEEWVIHELFVIVGREVYRLSAGVLAYHEGKVIKEIEGFFSSFRLH
jgi:hypothetical protein